MDINITGDGECTFFPDRVFGVDLTPACLVHDASGLGILDHAKLWLDVMALFGDTWLGFSVGMVMFAGTTFWCGLRYGLRGRRREA
ncbi:MAG: hypothetical protein AAF141_02770 [Pseudomonadota bacterium]